MSEYAKLFKSIVHSTIWRAPNEVRLVWVTMLALKDRDGFVEASLPGLADAARVSLDECVKAIEALKAPDPYSRTPDNEGRRIADAAGGWVILNHEIYRERASKEERREKTAARVRRHRDRRKAAPAAPVRTANAPPLPETPGNASNAMQMQMQRQMQIEPPLPPEGDVGEVPDVPAVVRKPTTAELQGRHELVRHFRARYSAVADPGFEWPIDVPSSETEAAGSLLRRYFTAQIHEQIEFVIRSGPDGKFRGWSRVVKSLAKLLEHWSEIDQRCRDAKDAPKPKWSATDDAIFKRTTFSEWQRSVTADFNSLPAKKWPVHAERIAEALRLAAKRHGFEMDPPPSTKDAGPYPWKAWR